MRGGGGGSGEVAVEEGFLGCGGEVGEGEVGHDGCCCLCLGVELRISWCSERPDDLMFVRSMMRIENPRNENVEVIDIAFLCL